jgi:hypothetical protein
VQAQTLDESTGSNESRRVLLTAAATVGSIVRSQSVVARAELIGRVAYSEDRLAAQAESIAKDASAYLSLGA